MNQEEKRLYLIKYLLSENNKYSNVDIPSDEDEQKRLLRSLFNVRLPAPADEEFLKVQDEYLQEETRLKGIKDIKDLSKIEDKIYLWQGDITTLRCDAIVNAANSGLTLLMKIILIILHFVVYLQEYLVSQMNLRQK